MGYDPTAASATVSANAKSALSVETAARISADNGLSNLVSALSGAMSLRVSALSQGLSVETAARTSADDALSTLVSALSVQLSLQVSALSQVVSAMSDRLSNLSDRVSVLETAGGGASVTSAELASSISALNLKDNQNSALA